MYGLLFAILLYRNIRKYSDETKYSLVKQYRYLLVKIKNSIYIIRYWSDKGGDGSVDCLWSYDIEK